MIGKCLTAVGLAASVLSGCWACALNRSLERFSPQWAESSGDLPPGRSNHSDRIARARESYLGVWNDDVVYKHGGGSIFRNFRGGTGGVWTGGSHGRDQRDGSGYQRGIDSGRGSADHPVIDGRSGPEDEHWAGR